MASIDFVPIGPGLPYRPPEDPAALRRLANRVHVSIGDIAEAQRYALAFQSLRSARQRVEQDLSDTLDAALGAAAIISYGRPFVSSRSDGVAEKNLSPEELLLFVGQPELESEHALVLEMRNKVVAHSDWSHRYSLEAQPDRWSDSVRYLVAFDTRRLLTDSHSFINLARHVQLTLVHRMMVIERRLIEVSSS